MKIYIVITVDPYIVDGIYYDRKVAEKEYKGRTGVIICEQDLKPSDFSEVIDYRLSKIERELININDRHDNEDTLRMEHTK